MEIAPRGKINIGRGRARLSIFYRFSRICRVNCTLTDSGKGITIPCRRRSESSNCAASVGADWFRIRPLGAFSYVKESVLLRFTATIILALFTLLGLTADARAQSATPTS